MKMDYGINLHIDIPEPTLKAITQAYVQILPMPLSDFFQTVISVFAEYYIALTQKPFCCERCGNDGEFIWKTRNGKSTGILSIFGMVRLSQLQVKCKSCGHNLLYYNYPKAFGGRAEGEGSPGDGEKAGSVGSVD